jgi:DNA-binding response OmpR family regulator
MRRRAVRVLVIGSERATAGQLAEMLVRAGFVVEVGECGAGTSIERAALCNALRESGYDAAIVAVCPDISDGGTLPAPSLLRWGPLELDCLLRTVRLRGRTIKLTSRDCELLACLIHADGRFVTRARLLEQVWQGRANTGTNVVEVHLSRLRDKLGEDAWLIQTVRRAGYRLRRTDRASE